MKKCLLTSMMAVLGFALAAPAHAVFIGNSQGGTDFPQGDISFADTVVSYTPAGLPSLPFRGAFNALGLPDYAGQNGCPNQANCSFVSLGGGGGIVLQFDDNKLTGSGNDALDIWIFEVGPNVEDTFVDISKDGINWTSVGKVFGSTAGIDIDAFGFTTSDLFGFVRLTDDINEGGTGAGGSVGADIDAVGAISSVRTVPEPGTVALAGIGLLGLFSMGRGRLRKPRARS
jgi:hypothetical protein